jgi:hypothetical protein
MDGLFTNSELLNKTDATLDKLLESFDYLKPASDTAIKRQKQKMLKSWKDVESHNKKASSQHKLKVKLPTFAETIQRTKKEAADKPAGKNTSKEKNHKRNRSNRQRAGNAAKGAEAGAKRTALRKTNRRLQLHLRALFDQARALPPLVVSPDASKEWAGVLGEYASVLRKDATRPEVAGQLIRLKELMTTILKSPPAANYLRDLAHNTGGASAPLLPVLLPVLRRYIKPSNSPPAQVDAVLAKLAIKHPYAILRQLKKIVGYTQGKVPMEGIEKRVMGSGISYFQAFEQVRKLQKAGKTPSRLLKPPQTQLQSKSQ